MPVNKDSSQIEKIIRRLELIGSLIALGEETALAAQVESLRLFTSDEDLESIILCLREKSYGKAMHAIETFITQHYQASIFSDPELERLRLEAKILEAEVNILSDEKADLEKKIYEFGIRHSSELGELILKILRLRKEKAKGTARQSEAERDYREYNTEYEIKRDEKITQLTEEERKELKVKFKKATKLCHPDVVREEQKEAANELFIELKHAYERNDLERVSEILESLEKGDFFAIRSQSITEGKLLRGGIETLRMRIRELRTEIQSIIESETYQTIVKIKNWDDVRKYSNEVQN